MGVVVDTLISNPMGLLSIFLSGAATLAFLMYAWGFNGYIISHGHDEHQNHARIYMIWGTWWLIIIFIAWQLLRWITGAFT